MSQMRRVALAACAAAAMIVPAAGLAQPMGGPSSGAYLGGSVGQAQANDSCQNSTGTGVTCEEKDTSWSVFIGYQWNQHFGFEIGYRDFGETSQTSTDPTFGLVTSTVSRKAFELVGLGILPLGDSFSLYGKFGAYFGEIDSNTNVGIAGTTSGTDSKIDLTYGLGVQFALTKQFGMRAEWQRYQDISGSVDVDAVAIGVVYRFK